MLIGGGGFECRLGCENGGIELQLTGNLVAEIAQLVEPVDLILAGTHPDTPDHGRPFGFGKGQGFFQCFLHSPRTRLWQTGPGEIPSLRGLSRKMQEIVIGEDMEGGAIPESCLAVAPVPECAKNGPPPR